MASYGFRGAEQRRAVSWASLMSPEHALTAASPHPPRQELAGAGMYAGRTAATALEFCYAVSGDHGPQSFGNRLRWERGE